MKVSQKKALYNPRLQHEFIHGRPFNRIISALKYEDLIINDDEVVLFYREHAGRMQYFVIDANYCDTLFNSMNNNKESGGYMIWNLAGMMSM